MCIFLCANGQNKTKQSRTGIDIDNNRGEPMNKDWVKGTTELLVLRVLKDEPMYGYGMIRHLDLISSGTFKLNEGTLYPILHMLEQHKYIESVWQTSEEGRRRKYYQITESGLRLLTEKESEWRVFSGALGAVLGC